MELSREEQVRRVLESLIPAMETDGGGVELVAVEGNRVVVRLYGACLNCPSINLTMKFGIGQTLRQQLTWVDEVVRLD